MRQRQRSTIVDSASAPYPDTGFIPAPASAPAPEGAPD